MSSIKELLGTKGREVFTIGPSATVLEAVEEMTARDVGALVVTEGKSVVGILSERDYVRKVVATGRVSVDMTVADIMS
ncbi:MAG TPA: CBS domain-containing protein, partial [Thermoleophilia bacterium]|nr:CBS domain-containing protein [Thermoleophilia bacterium]